MFTSKKLRNKEAERSTVQLTSTVGVGRSRFSSIPFLNFSDRSGQAVLTAILFLLFASAAFLFSFSSIALKESRSSRVDVRAKQSYFLAEAAVEDVLWRIKNDKQYGSGGTLTLDGATATMTVTTDGGTRIIESDGDVASARRKIKTTVTAGTGVSFHYGVQVGDLGLKMGNNSSVIGNVYSNGDIDGGGSTNDSITGTAISAGSHLLKDVQVNGDAYADRFASCNIGGVAHYVTSITSCPAGSSVHDASPQPAGAFPITQAQIDAWETDAAAGGTLIGYALGSNASASLGPKKVVGNLTVGNNSILTLTGTVWVTGTISLGNNVTIQLSPAGYGPSSGVIIMDGSIDLGNNAILNGSGQSGSYLMVLSTFGPGNAITLGNSAAGAIFYAPNGIIKVGNNLNLREATGRGLDVGNNASITYEAGLANVNFSSGPTGGWNIQNWSEVK